MSRVNKEVKFLRFVFIILLSLSIWNITNYLLEDITNYLNVYFGERDYQAVLILSLNIMLFTTIFIILHYFLKYNF
jgi:hypothetical protein